MAASFRVNLESIKFFMRKMNDPKIKLQLENMAHEKGLVALISQAIADNFDKEGPGWPALKNKTIRASVKGKAKKQVSDMNDKELERHEKWSRKAGASTVQPFRRILNRTGLLKKTVTTVGFSGSTSKGGKVGATGSNVYQVQNNTIIWGTNLPYAKVHQNGGKHVPQRKFLNIRPEWQARLEEWTLTKFVSYLRQSWAEVLKV